MTRLMILIDEPERSALGLKALAEAAPGVTVTTACNVTEALATIGECEVLVTLPQHLGNRSADLFLAARKLSRSDGLKLGLSGFRRLLRFDGLSGLCGLAGS